MEIKDFCSKEQADLLEDFRKKAKENNFEFFALVGNTETGEGASVFGTTEQSPADSAARHARQCHIEWEKKHGIDPDHDRNKE